MMRVVFGASLSMGSSRAALVVALVLVTLGDCGGGGGALDRRWKSKKGQPTITINVSKMLNPTPLKWRPLLRSTDMRLILGSSHFF